MKNFLGSAIAASMLIPAAAVPTAAFAKHDRYEYREWRGRDGRVYCRKSDGTVGLVVGAAGGALVGRAIDTRGDRATGTILGAAAGALIGKSIDSKRRCR
ncbi:MAG: glycine zipper 2TM domain-containing protein [Sphingobium sp.]